MARWKKQLTSEQLSPIETLVGRTLTQIGYELATPRVASRNKLSLAWDRFVYRQFFEAKLQWKKNPILHLLRPDLTSREIGAAVIVDDLAQNRGFALPNVMTSAPTPCLPVAPATPLESVASGD